MPDTPTSRRPRTPHAWRLARLALPAAAVAAVALPATSCAQRRDPVRKDAPAAATLPSGQWTTARARAWGDSVGWQVGGNYAPSTAGNQLEMWQAATWDPTTIDRELGWAQSLGMNTMRVFLHDLAYKQDPEGFLRRVDEFLTIAQRHGIRPMLVIFDSVWDPFPKAGPQRQPKPHLHNSVWVQSPGIEILADSTRHGELEGYVKAVVGRFGRDGRVLAWDLWNEPDNTNRPAYFAYEPTNKGELALALLRKTFAWARSTSPIQPLTVGPWYGDWSDISTHPPVFRYALENSDIVTFHSYDPLGEVQTRVAQLERLGRPIICTEYMARPRGSTFQAILPFFAARKVGAINWGFVQGKSQTIYPWDSWTQEYTAEPPVWFHDVFRTNGTPYDTTETTLIRSLTRQHVRTR